MELVTGRAGNPHITSQQDRQKHQGIWGDGAYILATGNQLEPEVQSSNKILIKDGAMMSQGALFSVKVGTTDEVMINNGNQGMKRKDLIVARYTYDSAQNKESAEWVVIQGTPAASNPALPSGISGDIQAGDAIADTPFISVTLDGINIVSVEVIPEVLPTLPDLIGNLNGIDYEIIKSDRYYVKKYKNGWFEADAKTTVDGENLSFTQIASSGIYYARVTNIGIGIKATVVYDIEYTTRNTGITWSASPSMNANMQAVDGYIVQYGADKSRDTDIRVHVTGKWK